MSQKSFTAARCGLDQKRDMINQLKDEHSVRFLCETLDVHRGALYHQPRPTEDRPVRDALKELAGQWPTYGYRRLTRMLHRQGHPVNAKRVRRLMHEMGICGEAPARRPRTTDSDHPFPRYPNLVEGLEVDRPDQVWVADITYVRLRKEFVYLAVLMDVFTRSIRGWHLGRSLEQELTITALKGALERGRPAIHHSDQGVQYAAHAYVEMLIAAGSQISMASVGEPRENGYAERLMRTIKEEEVDLTEYEDFADAWRQLGKFLDDVHNRKRIHSALGYLTPSEFGSCLKAIEIRKSPVSNSLPVSPSLLLSSGGAAVDEDLSRFCCRNGDCPDHGKRGHGNLTVCSRYGKDKHIRLLYCRTCRYRFSERQGTPLFGSQLSPDKALSVFRHLADRNGVRATARLVGVAPNTVVRYSRLAGGHARALHDELVALSPPDRGGPVRREVVVRLQEAGALRPG